ncbi:hypothetical protein [Luteolibacter marinus]|uniref:hypothetical protein n=1 Tax=Luteolibacter marinus TaxID=2776705 RepID=UPI001865C636|nr:hypothetical protein [Luteolibacter marinus]
MNRAISRGGLWCTIALLQAVGAEPLELTRLRQQYEHRVEQQIEPLERTYVAELAKLEKRLAKGGRLEDALAVKKERENRAAAGSSTFDAASRERITTAEDLAGYLTNTTWEFNLQRPNSDVDARFVILLPNGKIIFAWGNGIGTWKAISKNTIEYDFPAQNGGGRMKISSNLMKWEGNWSGDQFPRYGSRVGAGKPSGK